MILWNRKKILLSRQRILVIIDVQLLLTGCDAFEFDSVVCMNAISYITNNNYFIIA